MHVRYTPHKTVWLCFLVLLCVTLALRLYGIDWDQGALFHPDERAILMKVEQLNVPAWPQLSDLLDAQTSPLNPRWFSYGSLPLYLLKTIQAVTGLFTEYHQFELPLLGRTVSAAFSTASVALLFWLGLTWLGPQVALLAALFATFAVIDIQLSHFFAVDTLLSFFCTAALLFLARVACWGQKRDSVYAGILVGCALATKASASVLGIPLIVAHGLYGVSQPGERFSLVQSLTDSDGRARSALRCLLWSSATAVVTLLIVQPYMFIDFAKYWENVTWESQMVRRLVDVPYTRQYIDTPKYLYQMWQLGTYGLGPALGTLAWIGFAVACCSQSLRRQKAHLVILSWVVPYLLITGWFEVKFLRYMLPLVPFLLLYGAWLAVAGLDWLRGQRPRWYAAGVFMLGLITTLTVHYALAYMAIYARPHPGQSAAVWLREHTHEGSVILKEHWEEGIPHLPGRQWEELPLYEDDNEAKLTRIAEQLATGEYLVLYSNRLYATIPRLPERYPTSTRYYASLFDGSLGYELVHAETRIPQMLGIVYDEDTFGRSKIGEPIGYTPERGRFLTLNFGWADESFSVYDHPKTLIFKNTGHLSTQAIFAKVWQPLSQPESRVGLLLSNSDLDIQRAGGTFTDIVTLPDALFGVSWLLWLGVVQLIGLAALPLNFLIFQPLAGRGYLLSKTLGILIVAYLTWLMASIGVMHFSRSSVVVAALFLGLLSLLSSWRMKSEVVDYLRQNCRLILLMEAIFVIAFLAFLLVRWANPDLWHPHRGGEKPMDFAYLNAVTRSAIMPPYDPWFAGGYLNYYYYGQFIVAVLIHLTGIPPAIAYNLALPLFFALTVGGVFTIVYALVAETQSVQGKARTVKGPVMAGLVGVMFVAVAGNIDGLVQVVEGAQRVLFAHQPFGDFDYWRSSRMLVPGNEITEFPFFTFLFADLHAHLIAIPMALLALGLSLTLYVGIVHGQSCWQEPWSGVLALGLTIGALRITNTWDYPTQLAVASAAIIVSQVFIQGDSWWWRLRTALVMIGMVIAGSHFMYLPFHRHFELFYSGVQASHTQTPLWRYWVIHAPFLFLIVSYIVWQAKTTLPLMLSQSGAPLKSVIRSAVVLLVIAAGVAFYGYTTVAFVGVVLLALATTSVAGIFVHRAYQPFEVFVAGVVSMALAIGAGVDLLTVNGDIGRMNTVFKFYLQAWTLMGTASAYIVWRFATAGMFSLRGLSAGRSLWMSSLAVLCVGVLIYPVRGTQARLKDRFTASYSGLDGLAYMQDATYSEKSQAMILRHDLAAIQWLQQNIKGSPVIIEGLTDQYRWGNRVSINTGLPAVIGWDWHQRQQRVKYAAAVTTRRRDVDQMYSTPDPQTALHLLQKYAVSYVYVGALERIQYPSVGVTKFANMQSQGLMPVYTNDEVTIYQLTASHTPGVAPLH